MLAQTRLRELLEYSPITGKFIRLITIGNAIKGTIAGSRNGKGYICISIDGVNYRANRLAWFYMTGEWPKHQIDHKNGIRDDDRWDNLREATHTENTANAKRRIDNNSGGKGIRFNGKFQVRLGNGGKYYVGTFNSLEEAEAAYKKEALERYGRFARIK